MKAYMTYLAIILLMFIPLISFAQTFRYGNILKKNAKGNAYISKSGITIKSGSKILLGKPLDDSKDTFSYITQGGQPIIRSLMNKEVEIFRFQTFKQSAFSGKVYASFKGFGLIPVMIDYEAALESGEIINPQEPLTKEEAINKLKELKELLDLQIISQEDYELEKKKLSQIILGNQ